ncbi:DUF6515 family protein [Microbulbifer guangxiensis]|uniref:DUF6515 family protein n=1 Tax=Microbulbifer guangxiensis TaxID=2904249 RepID=UPI001F18A51F|nr:DUF6515 family protein [Microbulbifer guangxiensis]
MKTLISTLAAASLLLALPALADNDRRHNLRGGDSQLSGSAFERAYKKEKQRQREQYRGRGNNNHQGDNRQGDHRPKGRPDRDHGGKRWKPDGKPGHPGRDHAWGHDRDRDRDWDRDHHKRPYHGKPYYAKHGDWKRHYKRKYRHKHGRHCGHRHHWRPAHYHYGYRWRHLPQNFIRISVGGLGFFYSDGIFYRPYQGAYVVAQPPVGAIVTSLPGTAVSVVFGGRNYYVAYDTYYLWDEYRRGYRIVDNPGIYY